MTTANDSNIWYANGLDGIEVLAREGDILHVNSVNHTIGAITSLNGTAISEVGLKRNATFTDGTRALIHSQFAANGSSPFVPLLPDSVGPNGEFIFTIDENNLAVDGNGLRIDPIVATGYRYAITGGEFIGAAPPHDPTVDDDDNSYLLSSPNGDFLLDSTLAFPTLEHDFVAN